MIKEMKKSSIKQTFHVLSKYPTKENKKYFSPLQTQTIQSMTSKTTKENLCKWSDQRI